MRCFFAAMVLLLAGISAALGGTWAQFQAGSGSGVLNTWLPLKIGAGGYITGIDINPDGTKLIRTDTYGAYIWDGSQWQQLVTQSRMPAANFGFFPTTGGSQINQSGMSDSGVYAIASAVTNSSIIYMTFRNQLFKSTDKGNTFSLTNFPTSQMATNGFAFNARYVNRKMAIDPANASVVYLGTDANGIWGTTDGGTTWTQVSSAQIPTAVTAGYRVAFDAGSGTTGGRTNRIYICNDTGVYVSVNAGTSFAATAAGGPSNGCSGIEVAPSGGLVWAVDCTTGGGCGNVWTYTGGAAGTWTKVRTGSYQTVAIDPANSSHVVVSDNGGHLDIWNGSTWTGIINGPQIRVATDIPWLAVTNEEYMSTGQIMFDPTGSNLLYLSEGIGVWYANPPATNTNFTYTSQSTGIEQLISTHLVTPNGSPIVAMWDRQIAKLTNPNAYPSALVETTKAGSINFGWDVDWASSALSTICAIISLPDFSGCSQDGGTTWMPFNSWGYTVAATATANNGGGLIRVTVPSTTGLTTWSAGSGSIVQMIELTVGGPTAWKTGGGPLGGVAAYPVTVVDSTHIDLQTSTFASGTSTTGGNYLVYVPTHAKTSYGALSQIVNATNSGGKIQLTFRSQLGQISAGGIGCVSGVGGTTEANGCWVLGTASVIDYNNPGTVILNGSTFTHAYTSGGVIKGDLPQGGSITSSTPSNTILSAANFDYPYCTTDGGQTWTDISTGVSTPVGVAVTAASWTAAAGGTITYTTAAPHNMQPGYGTQVLGMSPSGYNFPNTTPVATASGTTFTITGQANPGAATVFGAIRPETGWNGAYTYNQHRVAADRVTANKFYLFNYLTGLYTVSNCGTPSLVNSNVGSTFVLGNAGATVRTAPGQAGHIFFTAGQLGGQASAHPFGNQLQRSCDGGVTFSAMSGTWEPWAVGLGPAAPTKTYPSIYYIGWNGATQATSTWGIWRSIDDANNGVNGACSGGNTWQKIGDYPLGWMSGIASGPDIAPDQANYGWVYIGNGNGFAYGHFN